MKTQVLANRERCFHLNLIWATGLLLLMAFFTLWGRYQLISHGCLARFIRVKSLQIVPASPIVTDSYLKKIIAGEPWIRGKEPKQQYLEALKWTMIQVNKSGEKVFCATQAKLYQNVLAAVGLPSRRIQLIRNIFDNIDTHVVVEVPIENKWILIDPTFGVTFTDSSGEPLAAQEINAYLLNGRYHEVKTVFYGANDYPVRWERYPINFLPLFNNVFVIDSYKQTWVESLPGFGIWCGPKMFYEKLPTGSDIHLKFVQELYFIFIVFIPSLIFLLALFIITTLIRREIIVLKKRRNAEILVW